MQKNLALKLYDFFLLGLAHGTAASSHSWNPAKVKEDKYELWRCCGGVVVKRFIHLTPNPRG